MAGQCLRGRSEAARGRLHRALTGSTTSWHFHRRVTAQLQHQRMHSKHRRGGWEQHLTGGDWWRRIPRGNPIQISSEGKNPRFPTGGVGRGGGGDHSVQASAAIVAGVSRNGQATTAAIQSPEGRRGPARRGRGVGLGRFDRHRPGSAG
jgi:hypothetical protein